jgi:hypothetical protein
MGAIMTRMSLRQGCALHGSFRVSANAQVARQARPRRASARRYLLVLSDFKFPEHELRSRLATAPRVGSPHTRYRPLAPSCSLRSTLHSQYLTLA